MTQNDVTLHVYDLSRGMAQSLSAGLLGTHIDGVWHTGVVVFGVEYFYGGGIQAQRPEVVVARYGLSPTKVEIGKCMKTRSEVISFLSARPFQAKYSAGAYDLFRNNCNNFSDDLVKFLTNGEGSIPDYVKDLPETVLQTEIGRNVIAPMYNNFQQTMGASMIPFNNQQPARPPARPTPPSISIVDLENKYGTTAVKFFSNFKKGLIGDIDPVRLNLPSFSYNIYLCDKKCYDKLQKTPHDYTGVLYIRSHTTKPITFDTSVNAVQPHEIERDRSSNDKEIEFLEISIGMLELLAEEGQKVLIVSPSGDNESIAVVLGYLAHSSNMTEAMNQLDTSSHALFISASLIQALSAFLEEDEKSSSEMIKALHPDSKDNQLLTATPDPVKAIMELQLPDVTEETARQVLAQTNGDLSAALNILL